MTNLFSSVLNMSMTGSIVILLVLFVRLLLKGSPKIFSYALWSVVLFRLLCPAALSAPVSLLGALQPDVRETAQNISIVSYIPEEGNRDVGFVPAETTQEIGIDPVISKGPELDGKTIASFVWIAGIAVMVLQSAAQYFRLRAKLVGAMLYRGDVYLADGIDMPFVMGILQPKIYLPSRIPADQRKYIIAHERHHIRRFDHIFKMFGYIALCIHWFNPLVWIAFVMAGKDMEMSCDEAVVRRLGSDIRADYSDALLRLSTRKKIISGMPLAFGEGDTRGRIQNMARWKKPKIWLMALCTVLCIVILVACAVNPRKEAITWDGEITIELPQEYHFDRDADGNEIFTDGTHILGGKRFYRAPEGFNRSDYFKQECLIAMGVPEASDDALGHFGGGSVNGAFQIEYFSDVPNPEDRTVNTVHQFYVMNDGVTILDIWIDLMRVDTSVKDKIYSSIEIPELDVFPSGLETVPVNTVQMPLEIGELPEGYSYDVLGEKCILFIDKYNVVGGIDVFDIPEGVYDPNDKAWLWLEEMGMSDFENPELCYIGGMTSGNYGWVAEFASDVPDGTPRTEHRRHWYRVVGNELYDIWVDLMLLTHDEAEDFLWAVKFMDTSYEVTQPSQQDPEAMAFEKTAAIMEAVANGGCTIVQTEVSNGNEGPSGYERIYHYNDGNLLFTNTVLTEGENITEAGEYYNRYALLYVEDRFFTNEATQGSRGDIQWEEVEPIESIPAPWLGNHVWVKSYVTYMDTLKDENGECLLFRYDRKFEDREELEPNYWVKFFFDPEGNFVKVQIEVNLFLDDAFTITESILSMDPETVNAEIQKEYQRAIE